MSSVEDVSQDMKAIDGQSLNQVAQGGNEIVCSSGTDNGVDNNAYISLFVRQYGTFMQQFLNDVREFFR